MCEYLSLYASCEAFIGRLEVVSSAANDAREWENKRARDIQRLFRGYCIRKWIYGLNLAATEIQRVFRGHLGRERVKYFFYEREQIRQFARFQYFALQLQKCFRGYYSRKYRRNHARRKQYIKDVIDVGEKVRSMLKNYSEEQTEREEREQINNTDQGFKSFASNLHHLVSTKQIPGIYNPNPIFKETPTVNDLPIDDHIRGVVKDLLRTRGIAKTGLVADLHGSRKIPYKGLQNKLSLQASAPYDMLEKEKSRQLALHRILTRDKGNFFSGGKTSLINHVEDPLCKGDPYMDAWSNPLLQRGVPATQKILEQSAYHRKPLFIPSLERPYYPRSGGNKSTILPNDLFDTIQDAEVTGGSIQRQLGHSKRFGVPDNCDNRPCYNDSSLMETGAKATVLPAPPPRASSFWSTRPRMKSTRLKVQPLISAHQTNMLTGASPVEESSSDEDEK